MTIRIPSLPANLTSDSTRLSALLALAFALLALSISPYAIAGPQYQPLLLVALMPLSLLVLMYRRARIILPDIDLPLITVGSLILLLPLLYHPEYVRFSTMLYSCGYITFFLMLARLYKVAAPSTRFLYTTISVIIYIFAVTLIIQQICVLLNLPPLLGNARYMRQSIWKLTSLCVEPSHTSLVVTILFYFYGVLRRLGDSSYSFICSIREDYLLWIATLWILLSTYNATGIVLVPILFSPWLTRRNLFPAISLLVAATVIFSIVSPLTESHQMHRVNDTLHAVLRLDTPTIIAADESAAYRITPAIEGAKHASLATIDDWVGHGIDTDLIYLDEYHNYNNIPFQGCFHVWYVYGFPVAAIFWIFICKVSFRRRDPATWIITLMTLFLSGAINFQPLWLLISLSYVCREKYRESSPSLLPTAS